MARTNRAGPLDIGDLRAGAKPDVGPAGGVAPIVEKFRSGGESSRVEGDHRVEPQMALLGKIAQHAGDPPGDGAYRPERR